MARPLANKVAIITGGASGIGEAAARLFVKQGARVLMGDVQLDKAQKVAEELNGNAAQQEVTVAAQACDVRQEGEMEGLVAAAVARWGRLDLMLNNAGYAGKNLQADAVMERLDASEFDKQLQVNLRGVALGTKHAARAMKRNPGGAAGACIINTASIAGLTVLCSTHGDPGYISAGYGSSKAGVVALTKLAACELAPYGIRCNAVAPGYTATPMVAEVLLGNANASQEEVEALLAKSSVLPGVAIRPSDIAEAMLYLATARCVNGHTLTVDCGLVAGVAGYVPGLQVDAELAEE